MPSPGVVGVGNQRMHRVNVRRCRRLVDVDDQRESGPLKLTTFTVDRQQVSHLS